MTAQFVDLSVFQPEHIDWQAYKSWSAAGDGISRVALRSSYGVGYIDQHFQTYRAGALAAGIDIILIYHYAYPASNGAQAEADWQHNVVGNLRPQDQMVLDFEEGVPAATATWAYTWLARQEANYSGKLPAIYASDYYIRQRLQDVRLAKYPLWLARWTFDPSGRPPCPPPWTSYTWLQYTDCATSIPGVAGIVDANISLQHDPPRKGDDSMDTSDPFFKAYFTDQGNGRYYCINTKMTMIGAIAQYWLFSNGSPRLPLSGELYGLFTDPDVVAQVFESAIIIYDPNGKHDHPDSRHSCYLLKASDPLFKQLMQQYGSLLADPSTPAIGDAITALQAQAVTIQGLQEGLGIVLTTNQHVLGSLGSK